MGCIGVEMPVDRLVHLPVGIREVDMQAEVEALLFPQDV